MDRCPNCQSELRPEWKFCIHCGTPVTPAPPTDRPQPPRPSTLPPGSPIRRPVPPVTIASLPTRGGDPSDASDPTGTGDAGIEPEVEAEVEADPEADAAPIEPPPLSSYFPPDDPEPVRSADDGQPVRRRLDIPLAAGILLGFAGAALIIYIVIVLSGRN